LIKRVIGVAGDTVKCCDAQGRLSVNGKSITEKYLYPGNAPSDLAFQVKVPKDSIWVMGDHRGASEDSRYHQEDPRKGMVPLNNVIGRAVAVVWPVSHAKTLQRPEVLTRIKP
jgi:signal peptidase I